MKTLLPFLLLFLTAVFLPKELHSQVVLNEFSAANQDQFTDNYGEDEDWIELYNAGTTTVDLSGYHLSDKLDNPTKFVIPPGVNIVSGGFLRVWASGRDQYLGGVLHTNFKITQTKNSETIVLAGPLGTIIDFHPLDVPNKNGHSWARTTNGGPDWGVALNPSPGASNLNVKSPYPSKPNISPAAGFYGSNLQVSIDANNPDLTVYYTINGQDPTTASTIYTGPFTINNTAVVKAIARDLSDPDGTTSFIDFHSYIINNAHSIPVVSITGNQIMNLMNGSWTAEPVGTFELFDESGDRVSDASGEFNKHGNDSWAYQQRGIDYITRDEFGDDHAIKHPIFDPQITDRDEFQRIILKAAANDNYPFENGAHIRDAYVHTLSQLAGLEMDERTNEPCILYVNGQYWGVYEMREKVDDHDFTKYYYDQGREWIDFLKTWGATWTEYGSIFDWNTLRNYILSNDMSDPANYAYVEDQLEVLSLIDYVVLHSHNVSTDWLNWNTAWWRGNKPTGQAKKWRYALWDEDATFGHYINYTGVPDVTANADPCNPEVLGNPGGQGHIPIFNALLNNQDFLSLYINRYADLNNSYFNCDFMIDLLDDMIGRIAPEMPQQIARWGGSVNGWQNNVQELRDFILLRCTIISDGIVDCYEDEGITGPYNIVVDVVPPGSGDVQINTIIGFSYPWSAEYFGGVDFDLLAIPNCGYSFSHWTVANHSFGPDEFSEAIEMSLISDDIITAFFNNENIPLTIEPVDSLCEGDLAVPLIANPNGGTWTGIPDGQFDPQAYGPGTHPVTYVYTHPNGCIDSTSIDIFVNTPPSVEISGSEEFCNGSASIIDAGDGFETYLWDDGSTTQTLEVTLGGTYSVTVSDLNACTATDDIIISETGGITYEANFDSPDCSLDCNGIIDVTIQGGMPPYEFLWNTGALSEDLSDLCFGLYNLTITDSEGCTVVTEAYELIAPNELTVDAVISQASCFSSCDGSIDLQVNGGTAPYTFTWDCGVLNEEDQQNLCAGSCTVIITDANGCQVSANYLIEEPEEMIALLAPQSVSCEGACDGAVMLTVTGGTAPYSFLWSNNTTACDLSQACTGSYSVIVTDANNCTVTGTVDIVEPAAIEIAATVSIPACGNNCEGFVDLEISGGTLPYTYSWSNGDIIEDIDNLCSGQYSILVTDANGCTNTRDFDIIENQHPEPQIVGATSFCSGGSSLLDAGSGFVDYLWSNAETSQTIIVSNTISLTVLVTDQNGCTGTDEISVVENNSLMPSITGALEFCEGENTVLDAGAGYDIYEWSTGETSQTITVSNPASISVLVTDQNGCTGTDEVAVIENNSLMPSINGLLEFCAGDNTILDAGIGYDTYEWSTGETSQTITVSNPGSINVLVTDQNGCTGTDEVVLIEHDLLTPSISGVLQFCDGDNTILDAGAGYETYAWSSGETSQSITVSNSATLSVLVTDQNGCTGTDEVVVVENSLINPNITGILEFCEGGNTILDAGLGYASYEWSTGANSQTISVSDGGDYSVMLTDSDGCSGTDNVLISTFPTPNPTIAGSSTFCSGSATTLDAGNYTSFLWSTGETSQTISVNSPGIYTVDIIDQNACSGSASIQIEESSSITPVITGAPSFCTGNTTILNVGAGFDTYLWSDGSIGQSLEVSLAGDYSVTVADAIGCSGESSIMVSEITPPNAVLQSNPSVCNTSAGGSIINLYDLILSGDTNGSWEDTDNSGAVGLFNDLNFNTIPAGDYNFIYTTNSALAPCEEVSYTIILTVIDCACPSVEFFEADPLCNGSNAYDLTNLENTNEAGTWTIIQSPTGTNPASLNGELFEVMNADAGMYTLQFELSNPQPPGCPQDYLISIEVDPVAEAGLPVAIPDLCQNDATIIDLNSYIIGAQANGVWTETSGTPSQSGGFDPLTGTFLTDLQIAGDYTFQYTVSSNGACPDDFSEVTVSINPLPIVELIEPTSNLNCNSNTLMMDANGSSAGTDFDIVWTGPGIVLDGNENTLTPTIETEGIYTLTITNTITGCSLSDWTAVSSDYDEPQLTTGTDQTLDCNSTAASLQVSGDIDLPFQILWTGPGINATNENSPTPEIDLPGTYIVTLSNPDNGCSSIDSIIVVENTIPPMVILQSTLAELDCNTPTASLIADSPTPNVDFEWFDDQNISIGNTAEVMDISEAGIYTLIVIDNNNGCTSTASFEVIDNIDYPQVNAGDPSLLNCYDTEISLDGSASQTGPDIVYLWEGPGVSGAPDQAVSSATIPGTYTLTVLNNSNGCSSSDQVIIDQDIETPDLILNQTEQLDCTIESVTLDGTGSSLGSNYTYSWIDEGGNIISTDLMTSVETPGVYTLNILNTTNGCDQSASMLITQNTNIPSTANIINYDPDCFGDTNGFIEIENVNGGIAPYLYAINGSSFTTNPIFSNLAPGTYDLIIQDANACQLETMVTINEPLELNLDLGNDLIFELGDSVVVEALVNIPVDQIDTIIWSPFSLINCNDPACLEIGINTINNTEVNATVIDHNGCVDDDHLRIQIRKSRNVFIPNIFSPNDDGLNDLFFIYGKAAQIRTIHTFQVFSRWGELVHSASNANPNDSDAGWDGRFKGKRMNPGVFIYMAEIEFIDGRREVYKGEVSLVR